MRCVKCHTTDLTEDDFHRNSKTLKPMKTCKTCTNTARQSKITRNRTYREGMYNPSEWNNFRTLITLTPK